MSGRRSSAISVRLDNLDDRGAFVIDDNYLMPPTEDNTDIAPWLEPPTPPPKSPGRIFTLTPKASFSSYISSRQNSAASVRSQYSDSQSSISTYTTRRRFTDDDSSSRYLDGASSTYSAEAAGKRRYNFKHILRKRSSKATLHPPETEHEHPSLRPHPVPAVSDSFVDSMSPNNSFVSLVPRIGIGRSRKHVKKDPTTPTPPPKDILPPTYLKPEFDDISDFVNPHALSSPPSIPELGYPDFRNPFSRSDTRPTPVAEKRKAIMPGNVLISPTTIPPSPTTNDNNWSPPPSWEVQPAEQEQGDTADECTDMDDIPDLLVERQPSVVDQIPNEVPAPQAVYAPLPNDEPRTFRLWINFQKLSVPGCSLTVGPADTVASVTEYLRRTFLNKESQRLPHKLYLKEKGKGELINDLERVLVSSERPAEIIRRRLEQAGFDYTDGVQLLEDGGYSFLLSFIFKSEVLGDTDFVGDRLADYSEVDLTGRGLRAIPAVLHKNDETITKLTLSRNPMLDLPLDFIQSCTHLVDLRLSNMAMKKVPASLRHSRVEYLDLSCNRIHDLSDAHLEEIETLKELRVQNNRIEELPFQLQRLKQLTALNISNNKFITIPTAVTLLSQLEELDVSFNMITDLPPEIAKLTKLKSFTLVGNRVSRFPEEVSGLVSLEKLDCRRNHISDLSVVCMLPQLKELSADHNYIYALDLCLGPNIETLDFSHNDITRLALVPGPLCGTSSYSITSLDLSYGKLSSLDNQVLQQLTSLVTLKIDHNSFRSIPDSLGNLASLETFSCSDNKLDLLPDTIGMLQKLTTLDAHNNSLTKLPKSLWNCASLTTINLTSNFIERWPDVPASYRENGNGVSVSVSSEGSLLIPRSERKGSTASSYDGYRPPSLVYSLRELYLGENKLKNEALRPLLVFKDLNVLNLSFNEIQDLPVGFFKDMSNLHALYLSGNKLSNLRAEQLPWARELSVLFVNGNKLQSLPSELAKLARSLKVLDAGSNMLKYNINNYEFDWNWNFNHELKYLNLSGNNRMYIKSSKRNINGLDNKQVGLMTGFPQLQKLEMLGLMDVRTDEDNEQKVYRRVRMCDSTLIGMGFGIADTLWKNDHLNLRDLVYDFRSEGEGEAIFAIFNRVDPGRAGELGRTTERYNYARNLPLYFLQDKFIETFKSQREGLSKEKEGKGETIFDALRRTFLKLNCDLYQYVLRETRGDKKTLYGGATGTALYFKGKTLYVANVGDVDAVISTKGVAKLLSRKHHPYDREETARIRAAEGWVSPPGLVNDEIGISRAFGLYHLLPVINARPDVAVHELTELDEFIIVANHGLWDFVPHQTAVDIARTVLCSESADPMIAAQKLRDFAISYGAEAGTMIMVIHVSDLFHSSGRTRAPEGYNDYSTPKEHLILDKEISRLTGEVPPPTGHLALVFTDIRNSTHLWEVNPGMPTAMRMHNNLLRRQLRFCGGYEVKTEGDAFMCSFPTTLSAVWWCLSVQYQLLHENWPLEILECDDGKPVKDPEGRLVARGLSVRMGIHCGTPVCEPDPITRRMDYFGPMVNRSARINGRAAGGQIMCSADVMREINAKVFETEPATPHSSMQPLDAVEAIRRMGIEIRSIGEVKLKGLEFPEVLSAIYPSGLEGRHDLDDEPAEHNPSGSRVQFSIQQMQDLGMICLRIEALASGRIFRDSTGRKGSIASLSTEESKSDPWSPVYFEADPTLLLPNIKETSSDSELTDVLDSLSVRIHNALSIMSTKYQLPQMQVSKHAAIDAISKAGLLGEDKLSLIVSILQNL